MRTQTVFHRPCSHFVCLLFACFQFATAQASELSGWLCASSSEPASITDNTPNEKKHKPATPATSKNALMARLSLPQFQSAWDVVHHQAHLQVLLAALKKQAWPSLLAMQTNNSSNAYLQVSTGDGGVLSLRTLAAVQTLSPVTEQEPPMLCVPVVLELALSRDGEGNRLLSLPPAQSSTLVFTDVNGLALRGFQAACERAQIKFDDREWRNQSTPLACTLTHATMRCKTTTKPTT